MSIGESQIVNLFFYIQKVEKIKIGYVTPYAISHTHRKSIFHTCFYNPVTYTLNSPYIHNKESVSNIRKNN